MGASNLKILLLISFAFACEAAVYPSTYPFENEPLSPPILPESTPDYSYDMDNDPGGYITKIYKCDLNDPEFMTEAHGNYWDYCEYQQMYAFYATNGAATAFGVAAFNCSEKREVTAADLGGVINSKTVCTNCCPDVVGQKVWGEDFGSYLSLIETATVNGVCDTVTHETYCVTCIAHAMLCIQHFIDAGERTYVIACFDSVWHWLMTCSVFKTTGVVELVKGEDTLPYLNSLSAVEQFVVFGFQYYGDRVCLPYSYYFPEATGVDPEKPGGEASDDESSVVSLMLFNFLLGIMVVSM